MSSGDKNAIMRNVIDAAKRAGREAIILVEHDGLVAEYSSRIVALTAARCSPTGRRRSSSATRRSSPRSWADVVKHAKGA